MGYLDLVGSFVYKQFLSRAKLDGLGENDQFLKDNGWQDGTKAVFFQASVPLGWTQDVSLNDRGLRVVSVLGGITGGSNLISSPIQLAHAVHTIPNQASHTHDITGHTHFFESVASDGSGVFARQIITDGTHLRVFLLSGAGTPVSIAFNRLLQNVGTITTGPAGSHNHGGTVDTSSLTDISLAFVDVIVGSKDVSAGYTDLTNEFNSNDKLDFDPFPLLDDNDDFNNDRLTPAGTIMVFGQAAAPSGWTQIVADNDKILRVVSGAGGGNGGSNALSSTISLQHIHFLSQVTMGAHTFPAHRVDVDFTANGAHTVTPVPDADDFIQDIGGVMRTVNISGPTGTFTRLEDHSNVDGAGSTEPGSFHQNIIGSALSDIAFSYFDVIQCSKDSGGAPFPFVDLQTRVTFKKLVSRQRLNDFAKNDEHLKFHTIPNPTRAHFFQANAPLTWTQLSTQDNQALRIVSGAGGGSFSGQGFGSSIILVHSHSIANSSDEHIITYASHQHNLVTSSVTSNDNAGSQNGIGPTTNGSVLALAFGGGSGNTIGVRTHVGVGTAGLTDTNNHDHGGVTGNALSDVTIAHADVIYCEKNI